MNRAAASSFQFHTSSTRCLHHIDQPQAPREIISVSTEEPREQRRISGIEPDNWKVPSAVLKVMMTDRQITRLLTFGIFFIDISGVKLSPRLLGHAANHIILSVGPGYYVHRVVFRPTYL
uniref:Uncharacterized protein n=1 Tax=Moniliophthora roreri TaxID=221103 RepID=A0A0W0GF14_MONRR